MNNSKRFSIAFCLLCLSLVFSACSKDDPDLKSERKISKISTSSIVRTLVEDVATGQVISDDTQTFGYSEETFIWDGDFLKNVKYVVSGELLSSYVYSYTKGRLAEVKDEADGQLLHLSYSGGHLVKIENTTESDAMMITQLLYDEHGRVKSISNVRSDGSVFPEVANTAYLLTEFEYSGNNISRETVKYYHSIESDEPYYTPIFYNTYSSAINPLKGLFTFTFGFSPSDYFTENVIERQVQDYGSWGKNDDSYEVISDGEYPVKVLQIRNSTSITDGKRTTVEYTNVADYEYLD